MRLVARTASTARNYRRRGLVIGAEGVGCQHVRLGDVRVEGFLDSVGSWNGTDVTVDRLTMRGHVQGLYLADPTRWTVRAGSADKINLGVASGGPGENSVLVETDAPFLTPMPFRGRPNASYLVPTTARVMAEVRGLPLPDLCRALDENAEVALGGPWPAYAPTNA